MQGLSVTEYKNIRVLTTQQIAEAYGTTEKVVSNNFNNNKERYVQGKHYILLQGERLKAFKGESLNLGIAQNVNKLYLWTQKGAFLHAKSLNTDVAWDVYDRLVDHYFDSQDKKGISRKEKTRPEHLASVNNAVKILTPMLEAAGCTPEIQLLTAKSLYERAGVLIPIDIKADKHYVDTVHIARHVGLYYQSSGKPADKAVNEIIRRLNLPASMYTETWESKGNWQGAVRKYDEAVIGMVRQWYADNGYPKDIEYIQTDGQKKAYHVTWKNAEVA